MSLSDLLRAYQQKRAAWASSYELERANREALMRVVTEIEIEVRKGFERMVAMLNDKVEPDDIITDWTLQTQHMPSVGEPSFPSFFVYVDGIGGKLFVHDSEDYLIPPSGKLCEEFNNLFRHFHDSGISVKLWMRNSRVPMGLYCASG